MERQQHLKNQKNERFHLLAWNPEASATLSVDALANNKPNTKTKRRTQIKETLLEAIITFVRTTMYSTHSNL